jgi:hypothetical protein
MKTYLTNPFFWITSALLAVVILLLIPIVTAKFAGTQATT